MREKKLDLYIEGTASRWPYKVEICSRTERR